MPQKKNPDILELVRGRCGTVIGHMVAAFAIVKGLPYSYNSDLQEVTPQLLRSLEISRSSLRIMAGAVSTLKVNKKEMARKSTLGFTTATEIADTIVRATGLPFRTAHGIVGRLARGRGDPSMADADEAYMAMIGKKLSEMGMTQKMLEEAMDPWKNVERRKPLGGPAKAAVLEKIAAEEKRLESDGRAAAGLQEKLDEAGRELSRAIDDVTSR
jgi:argininosuccinate lyase